MEIKTPYLVFLGDAQDYKQAKTAMGLIEWRPELCIGQLRLEGCKLTLGLPDLTISEARSFGAVTFVIGISPFTRDLPKHYESAVMDAINAGMNIANPLHNPLPDYIVCAAESRGVDIYNFRHRPFDYPKGTGEKRTGLRLLTVGTDCACGKKYTALTIHRELLSKSISATFRSTGQTGFLISGSGINNDTIQADFLSGAAEWLSPDNEAHHWDIVEGQGSLSHPSFGGGSLSLLHGTQPDIIVMCHEVGRLTHRGVRKQLPDIVSEIQLALLIARRNNPNVKLGAVSLFTLNSDPEEVRLFIDDLSRKLNVPIFDPAIKGMEFQRFILHLSNMSDLAKLKSKPDLLSI
jgi:uncharacterized NAD-dependent epimerase/dehydratase family protein